MKTFHFFFYFTDQSGHISTLYVVMNYGKRNIMTPWQSSISEEHTLLFWGLLPRLPLQYPLQSLSFESLPWELCPKRGLYLIALIVGFLKMTAYCAVCCHPFGLQFPHRRQFYQICFHATLGDLSAVSCLCSQMKWGFHLISNGRQWHVRIYQALNAK